jgi:hypothetical protein
MDESRISNIARSPDWIATEYNNQSTPATFFALSSEGRDSTPQITPAAVNLFAAQNQQFALLGMGTCSSAAINWTINPSDVGTISQTGLYTAPGTVLNQQTVTVTAETPENNNPVSATVTLLPSWSGPAGTVITINGLGGFGSAEGSSSVTVGGLPAVTLSWSDTQIQIQIPTGTGLGPKDVVISVAGQPNTETTFSVTPGLVGITPLPTGIVASTTIDTPNQTAPLIFNGTAGQLATVSLSSATFGGWGNPAQITILSPDGSTLLNQFIFNGNTTNPVATLPTTGTYTLIVSPGDYGNTGSATVTLWLFNNLVGTITPGIPVTPTINIPGQEELLTFSGIAGQSITVSLSNSSFSNWCNPAQIAFLSPDGLTLINQRTCNGNTTNPVVTLPTTGTYTLIVAPGDYGTTGSATVLLTETVLSITMTPPNVTLDSGQTQQFTATVSGATNTAVTWTLTPATGAATNGESHSYQRL